MTIKLPFPPKQYELPILGKVVLKILTTGDVISSFNNSQIVVEEERASVFIGSLLDDRFIEPKLDRQDIEKLPQEAKSALINLLVDEMDLRDEFDSLVEISSIGDRLYRAMIWQNEKYLQFMQERRKETERRSDELGPLLKDAKFWISPSTPMGLFSHLIALYENSEGTPALLPTFPQPLRWRWPLI